MPCALEMPAGKGKQLQLGLNSCIDQLIEALINTLASEEYMARKNSIFNEFLSETNALYLELDQEARLHGFSIAQGQQGGLNTIPINKNGEVMGQEEYVSLNEEERAQLMSNSAWVQEKINEATSKYRQMETMKEIEESGRDRREVSQPYFDELFRSIRNIHWFEYLQAVQQDILSHLDILVHHEENNPLNIFRRIDKRSFLRRYQVNLLVDNRNAGMLGYI